MKHITNKNHPIYELIIIGAGASGLFAGASLPKPLNGLIIEKSPSAGNKLLMSGSGQCNLTQGGSIKNFVSHYGENGHRIRPILYRFNNLRVQEFFNERGVPLFEREDVKVFPKSLSANDVLDLLLKSCIDNGLNILYSSPVTAVNKGAGYYEVHCGKQRYWAKKLIVATGGCSYPTTGSNGNFFPVLEKMGINTIPTRPALVPIYVDSYPYGDLSGISIENARVYIDNGEKFYQSGDILFTHNCFSGPAILNASRYATSDSILGLNYIPTLSRDQFLNICLKTAHGNRKQLSTMLFEILNTKATIPKRLIDRICIRACLDPTQISSNISRANLTAIARLLVNDSFAISKTGGFKTAMVTTGGICLDEINIRTLESKKYPGIYFVGEALNIDGDTGGYNLQFAFSSAYTAAMNL